MSQIPLNPDYKVTPDYRVAKLSLIGIAGFFAGCFIFFLNDLITPWKTESVFHEIEYNPRQITDSMLTPYHKRLADSLTRHQEQLKNIDQHIATQTDSNGKQQLLAQKNQLALIIKKETEIADAVLFYNRFYKDIPGSDTSSFNRLNKVLHFNISPRQVDSLENCYRKTGDDFRLPLYCSFKDPEQKITDSIGLIKTLSINRPVSDIAFLGKYPAIGVWLLLTLVFCSFCFMIVPTAINLRNKSDLLLAETSKTYLSKGTYWLIVAITGLLLLCTMAIWRASFFDDTVVKDIFFMKGMRNRLGCIIFIGVAAGTFCMAGFIHIASILSCLAIPLARVQKDIKLHTTELQQLKDRAAPEINNAAIIEANVKLRTSQEEEAGQKAVFEKFSSYFQNYFIMAAIVLSFTVLCTGTLFQGIQSLDFVKMLSTNWGYSPARNDFVYFYGLLFTIVLLLVYIPTKIKFNEVDVWSHDTSGAPKSKWSDFLKNPLSSMKDLLVATSPLLVGLLQSLFDALFK